MKVLVIQGPNLNMLGHRDPRLYGTMTLEQIHSNMKAFATQQKLYKIKAILYGMTTMLESGELSNNTETFEMIREMIADELKA